MVTNLIKKNDILKLNIEDVTLEGVGIGRYNGMAVFVPQTVVGDIVEAKIIKVKTSYLIGRTENILVPSEDRIALDCPVSRQCGGCAFRHISYAAELKIKQKHVKDCLERIGGFKEISIDTIIGANKVLRYRNKAQIPFGYGPNGDLISGFYANHSHRIVPCGTCLLQPKVFDEIIEFVKAFMMKNKISAYSESTRKGLVRHVYLRSTEGASNTMLCMVLNGNKLPHCDALIRDITSKFNCIKSIFININKSDTNVILGEKFIKIFGEDYLTETLCGKKFMISPNSFYQVNQEQTEVLYNIGKSVLNPQKSDSLLDLYCGVGTIGLSMADRVASLCGVEIVESAVKNATRNAEINNIKNAEFFCGDSSEVVRRNLIVEHRTDVVIVDPPRKGCSDELLEDVIKLAPKKLLYISCNPATLAKDLQKICSGGYYEICKVVPVDMFPRTAHVETVVLLRRIKVMHNMKLESMPFSMIKSGNKTIELRLFDEKRQKIKANDEIVFTNISTGETVRTVVAKLHCFDSFEQLYKTLPLVKCGYTAQTIAEANPSDMNKYYSLEEQKKYGVVGVEIFVCE